jgi:hypothetical protein
VENAFIILVFSVSSFILYKVLRGNKNSCKLEVGYEKTASVSNSLYSSCSKCSRCVRGGLEKGT